ncbi:MAG TPA: UDP-N-acetylmuramoyl-tripeptide--D-alanyl-D-alanine ligase [Steroidobacteraceae bacterium]|jgi:UDP-N-acetylmuramoyl-tripeptide--D-alanyl-D-alanine ligase|nr:UDP-N-acetylmuramoyl-tripeptide--D-alanyl-D-alanine ligase [Steroidobacteraceae bacterium]
MNRTLAQFAQSCGGSLVGADRGYTGVSTDTRTLKTGELFVALRGPRFNANDFVLAAEAAGAAGAVVDTRVERSLPQIVVRDTQAALTTSAAAWRAGFSPAVVGVAGSNGKTTVKEMIAAILARVGKTLATRGNLNNHIGVPLTLHRLDAADRYAVVEIGANRAGEVADLVKLARPTVGLITNAGAEHLEGFGSLEGVARAEGEMVAGLDPAATAVINADDEFAPLWRELARGRVITFGVANPADFSASDLHTAIDGAGFVTRFKLRGPQGVMPVELHLAGAHNVLNALCAAAAASAAGASLDDVRSGLATMRPVPGRLQFKTAPSGAWIVDDSYNANPSSMKAGIEVLASVDARRWLVMGDMGELGSVADASHGEIGRFARNHRIDRLFAIGKLSQLAVEAFGSGGEWFSDTDALTRAVNAELTREVCVLVKGSRMNRLERVVEALVGQGSSGSSPAGSSRGAH